MVTPDLAFDATVQVATGSGRLVRTTGACLFVPPPIGPETAPLIERVLGTKDDLIAAVGDFILEHDDVPPFVLVTWPTTGAGDAIHLLVRGDASVDTDMASVPALSGVGSTTWAEHRVRRQPESAMLRSGEPADADTALVDGIVPAGGFSMHLTPAVPTTSAAAPAAAPAEPARAPTPAPASAPAPDSTPPPSTPSQVPAEVRPLGLGLAALRAASGTAPLDDGVAPGVPSMPPVADSAPAEPPVADPTEEVDTTSEPSVGSDTGALPGTRSPKFPDQPRDDAPHRTASGDETPTGPPAFPGSLADDSDPEVTLSPEDLGAEASASVHRLIRAALCHNGHSNPPHQTSCRVCGADLEADQTTTVEQPVLAIAQLPSGDQEPIDSNLILGRNPSAEAARLDADHRVISLDAPSSVSRTHIIICADGWTITATDCGSQGGSALVPDGADEPIELTAWMPHELNGGDTLYLGGLTPVRILDVPG